jgi:ferrous iron transport protein A
VPESLADLPDGARGRIERIDGALATRLGEVGLVPGSEVEVIRALPWGGPVLLDHEGFRFAIRRVDAAAIIVKGMP